MRNVRSSMAVLVAVMATPAIASDCVALVADLKGRVTVSDRQSSRRPGAPAELLKCYRAGEVFTLESGAAATLFFAKPNVSEELQGAGRFEITPVGVNAVAGSGPPKRAALDEAFRGIRIDRSRLIPAGVQMRTLAPSGAPETMEPQAVVTAAGPVEFRWRGGAAAAYRLWIANAEKRVLHTVDVEGTTWAASPEMSLPVGEPLYWQVAVPDASPSALRWQPFVIATPQARQTAEHLARANPAPGMAELNLRELLLMQQMGLAK